MEPQPAGARSCRRGAPGGACELGGGPEAALSLAVHSTTGTRYELAVPADETVEGLRRRLSQRLKVPKERLALLHKDTRLSSGKLRDLGVGDGSKLTLVPTVEAGLMSQASRPEQSVMQALESLTETQVSDFLSGRSPLTLALRVGDHMMFVQLQLAAQHAPPQPRPAPPRAHDPGPAAPPRCPAAARVPPAPGPAPVTSGSFCSHSAPGACAETDCSPAAGPAAAPAAGPAARSSSSRKPGAVIESFVNHAPGVFSGTFSGTLHPNCQDSSGRPRRDIGTILQILHDLLSATRHYQGMPATLSQLRCHAQCSPDLSPKSTSCEKLPAAPATLSQVRVCKPPGDRLRQTENRATRCKVERLQLLLQQKRLRRKARRDARGPYHWPSSRKAGPADGPGSGCGAGPGEAASLGLDFEDSVWKPDVNPDLKSEFVVA